MFSLVSSISAAKRDPKYIGLTCPEDIYWIAKQHICKSGLGTPVQSLNVDSIVSTSLLTALSLESFLLK